MLKSRWEYFDISKHERHISFFNPQPMRVLAGKSGFKVESVKTPSVLFLGKEDSF
jgi:hypothetical protein